MVSRLATPDEPTICPSSSVFHTRVLRGRELVDGGGAPEHDPIESGVSVRTVGTLSLRLCGQSRVRGATCGEVWVGPNPSPEGLSASPHISVDPRAPAFSMLDLDKWFEDDELGECPVASRLQAALRTRHA